VTGLRPGVDAAVLRAVQDQLAAHEATWSGVLDDGGLVDAELKELCLRYVTEDDDVVTHADDPGRYDDRRRAALAWVHAIAWNQDAADDALFERLHQHFTDPQLVELGTYVSIALGQRNWLRTLGPLEQLPFARHLR
jgi:alkylhydroperoxidase family enzyme